MNNTVSESVKLVKELLSGGSFMNKVLVAPPFTSLSEVSKVLKGTEMLLGAQNMASVESGAHTGEISVLMLKDLDVDAVILGHSERRHIYGETDELINAKVKLALHHDLDVILCVGETLDERESGKAEAVVKQQLVNGLRDVTASEMNSVVVAYEPVWAIGTGKTASPEDAQAIHRVIRDEIKAIYGDKTASDVIIQYGGSVKPGNVVDLMAQEDIDGALVGGACLKAESFSAIIHTAEKLQ